MSVDTRFCAEDIKNFDQGGLCEMHRRWKKCR